MNPIESIRSSITASRALCAAATPGPWARLNTKLFKGSVEELGDGKRRVHGDPENNALAEGWPNIMDFAAHARQALPAHVDALEIAVAALEEAVLVLRGEVPPQYAGVDREGLPIELEPSSAETTCGMMAMGLTAALAKIAERLKETTNGKAWTCLEVAQGQG